MIPRSELVQAGNVVLASWVTMRLAKL